MNFKIVITALLGLISGVGLFVVACSLMSSNLESIGSEKLKALFAKVSNNKLIGVLMGAFGTAAIQSSGATMVMIIGFVNANIMSLAQATTIMYGSDIGTTFTAQLVALGLVSNDGISSTLIFSSLTGIGVLLSSVSKNDTYKKIGGIFTGFGMLFIGLDIMSNAMEVFASLPQITIFLANISSSILLVILGALLTAIIQSSSVMTSLSITMVFAGLITIDQGIFLTMGANIGSCAVGMMAGMSGSTNAKRTALIQLIYNIGGVILFMIIGQIIKMTSGFTYGDFLNLIIPNAPESQLALFHLLFNVISAIICLPLTEGLVKISMTLIKEEVEVVDEATKHLKFLDTRMLKNPSIAVEQVRKEIERLSKMAMDNFNLSISLLDNLDLDKKKEFEEREKTIDFINDELTAYITDLSQLVVNKIDSEFLSKTYRVITHYERIGDYAENIVEYATFLDDNNESFSSDALIEIKAISKKINELYLLATNTYNLHDLDLLYDAEIAEDEIDDMVLQMNTNHFWRMENNICDEKVGAKFLSLSSDIERIGDHLFNVAKAGVSNVS